MAASTPDGDGATDRFGLVGTVIASRFRIDDEVVEGGFGVVYQGFHLGIGREVAVKVLKTPAEFNERARQDFMDRFALEARTVARLRHPHIVPVLDYGVAEVPRGGRAAFMVLEWVAGRTLEADLRARRNRGGRSPAECVALLRGAMEALAFVHGSGIAHRDIKPSNLMLVPAAAPAGGEVALLLDFGIAKVMRVGEVAGSGDTRTSSINTSCSPRYASPEQLSGARTGPWTDVHALGLILTEMLLDQPPYSRGDITVAYMEALGAVRPTPARRGVDVGAWEPVLARAMALRPGDRYPDAGALLAALDAALPAPGRAAGNSQPDAYELGPLPPAPVPTVEAAPPSRAATTSGGARRTWALLGVGVAALLGLGVAGRLAMSSGRHGGASAVRAAMQLPAPDAGVRTRSPR